jgi:hypothetical protein
MTWHNSSGRNPALRLGESPIGPDQNMVEPRLILAAGCPKIAARLTLLNDRRHS